MPYFMNAIGTACNLF